MKIFLVGYMGSGKSFLGEKLSKSINYKFIDLDEEIEKVAGNSIKKIFKKNGELYFRKLENEVLRDVLQNKTYSIISLGGGTPCYGNNMNLINESEDAVSFYLKVSVEELTERLFKEKSHRPLISHLENKEALEEFVRKHLFERGFYYNQAKHIINIDKNKVDVILKDIINKAELF
ncbi:shikimate kinase [Zunongwangia sp.]|uniref:shikimate kinase n=1 Tax=Zunongwangia sp. TaxID=1965325 RepID=UPI003AA97A6E